jgi:hypothetical protein
LHVLSTPPAFVLSQDQTLRQKNNENIVNPGRKHHHPPHGGGARVAANSTKQKIWYQQTWHTIEFSNNRPATGTHAPETVSKLFIARTSRSLATALNSSPSVADPVPSHKRLPTAQRCSPRRFEGFGSPDSALPSGAISRVPCGDSEYITQTLGGRQNPGSAAGDDQWRGPRGRPQDALDVFGAPCRTGVRCSPRPVHAVRERSPESPGHGGDSA